MGWANRNNPRSEWNRKKRTDTNAPISVQTTDRKHLVTATNPAGQDEPMVMELTLKNIWGYLCQSSLRPSPAPTS